VEYWEQTKKEKSETDFCLFGGHGFNTMIPTFHFSNIPINLVSGGDQ